MATENEHSGTLRTNYEASIARLEDIPVVESNRDRLLHRLVRGSESTLRPLLENHVLTVLVDIRRKRLAGYPDAFADAQSTAKVTFYADKLRGNIKGWVKRLDAYIDQNWRSGRADSIAMQTARKLADSLKVVLSDTDIAEKEIYFSMLRTVTAIREQANLYTRQVEESGDTEPALALLLAYLKNYSNTADIFNRRFASLPGLYFREILHAEPQASEPDNAYVIVTLMEEAGSFTLPAETPFPAEEELVYKTVKEEYISPMRCVEVNTVYQDKGMLYKHPLLQGTEQPFAHGKSLSIGWQIESFMLVLEEGERKVTVLFSLTADSVLSDSLPADTLALQLSGEEGWTERMCQCSIKGRQIVIDFTLKQGETAPAACTEEMHGTVTEYPALRLLTGKSQWVSRFKFDAVEIQTRVSGIRNFTLHNELGQVDTNQPFSPFGIQAECGVSFLFGNEEIGLKALQEVHIKGKWQKLPKTRKDFNSLYKEYGVKADSFTISTEYQKEGRWYPCGSGQKLFCPDKEELTDTEIAFHIHDEASESYEYNCDKDGFFRVTLEAPAIGFGTDAYRKQFMKVMMHNSHCKEKNSWELPEEPSVPLLADVELSYIALERTRLADIKKSSIRLNRITALSELEVLPIGEADTQPFLLPISTEHMLYFAFAHAEGAKTVRMYIDMALPGERIPFGSPQPGQSVKTNWELWNGSDWQAIDPESVKAEETCGLTQSGFIEITLPVKIGSKHTDKQGRIWLRAALTGDVSACLAIRNVWTNCIRVVSVNGDGTPLPAGTLQELEEIDERIENIMQPLSGFGGRQAETETQCAVRQQMRIHNRHRAVTMKDYEEIVLEHFPEVDKAQCISIPKENAPSEICLVVFSRAEDNRYFLSPAWKLEEIRRTVSCYASPFVPLKVFNPKYEKIEVYCRVVLRDDVQDESKVLRQLVVLAQNCIAPWYRTEEIPDSGQYFSYKELHARMANHEDLMGLVSLEVGGISLPNVDIDTEDHIFKGSEPWSILLPKIEIELLSPGDGIEGAEIGGNFIIG